ncbi:hypothetical protein P1X14_12365 [Sphingomonas sp. AOB5]|uniref:hypothetical protein n=1 Tax=Sphingomonas sp. AOB5 TaxID=3034017 RepID=UPI0023F9C441|nr:hypothetical protein [Sphingomonas sp. AOB5]MDF7776044.1 hypothetical protein [Sphingomonas sp. AOB5]
MNMLADQAYYARRAAKARTLATAAADPGVKKIHLQMAARYDDLAGQSALHLVSQTV